MQAFLHKDITTFDKEGNVIEEHGECCTWLNHNRWHKLVGEIEEYIQGCIEKDLEENKLEYKDLDIENIPEEFYDRHTGWGYLVYYRRVIYSYSYVDKNSKSEVKTKVEFWAHFC